MALRNRRKRTSTYKSTTITPEPEIRETTPKHWTLGEVKEIINSTDASVEDKQKFLEVVATDTQGIITYWIILNRDDPECLENFIKRIAEGE